MHQYKKIGALLIVFTMMIAQLSFAGTVDNFVKQNHYDQGTFIDVSSDAWYSNSVSTAFEFNLINGKGEGRFDPNGTLTWAEAIKLASSLRSIYETGNSNILSSQVGDPWYKVYVDYAKEQSIISTTEIDYNTPVTRLEFANLFASVFPVDVLNEINTIENDSIPDVPSSSNKANSVYLLYRAGILTGSDQSGTFYPNSTIKRSEVSTIVIRMIKPNLRKAITLVKGNTNVVDMPSSDLNAAQISEKCSDAVFSIEVYDEYNHLFATGSGFFINQNGSAVTNYHVLSQADHAVIKTTNGKTYDIKGITAYDVQKDIALLSVDGDGFKALSINRDPIIMGQNIYAIGSPEGLNNTISQGIVSNVSRTFEGQDYIQITAPISEGSSGGALINDRGQVIGVTSAVYTEGQNLNFALPISIIDSLDKTKLVSVAEVSKNELDKIKSETRRVYPLHLICMHDTDTYITLSEQVIDAYTYDFVYQGDAEKYLTLEWGEYNDYGERYLDIQTTKPGKYRVKIVFYDENNNPIGAPEFIKIEVLGDVDIIDKYQAPNFGSIFDKEVIDFEAYSEKKLVGDIKQYNITGMTEDELSDMISSYIDIIIDYGFEFDNYDEGIYSFIKSNETGVYYITITSSFEDESVTVMYSKVVE